MSGALHTWWTGDALPGPVAVVHRQVRVAELEAAFSLACTLAVCVHQEWGAWDQVGAAIAVPIAMAFSVHGLNNARGLGRWNLVYLPARIAVIALGVAYSYQHYFHFLDQLEVFGFDLRPVVAVTMELLTLSALLAHEAHTTRLTELQAGHPSGPVESQPAHERDPAPVVPPEPAPATGGGLTLAARLQRRPVNGHPIATASTSGGNRP